MEDHKDRSKKTEQFSMLMPMTWTRTVERERGKVQVGWKRWIVAKAAAYDRGSWADNMTALCAYWRNER